VTTAPHHNSKDLNSGIATGVPVQFLSVGGGLTLDDFPALLLETTTFLDGVASPPTVMTTSYGFAESFFGLSVATYVNHVATESIFLTRYSSLEKSATPTWPLGHGEFLSYLILVM
jgi:hypothetical protein